jgi:hypothetical protein
VLTRSPRWICSSFEMEVRTATETHRPAIEHLARAGGFDGDVAHLLAEGVALVAVEGGEIVGAALAEGDGTIQALDGADGARRDLAVALARAFQERGVETLRTELAGDDEERRALLERWGFLIERVTLAVDGAELVSRLDGPSGASYGAIHVQTDDEAPLLRALGRFVPRLPDAQLTGPHNGWIAVTHPQLDADPKLLRRLARELSVVGDAVVFVLGVENGAVVRYALLERGSLVDEYLSVPEYLGALPPGEVIALGANPTAVARLTGANAAVIRSLCRTAASPAELPPADELYRQIADAVGLPT